MMHGKTDHDAETTSTHTHTHTHTHKTSTHVLTFWKPMSAAFSRKQRRQIMRPYLRIKPLTASHLRLLIEVTYRNARAPKIRQGNMGQTHRGRPPPRQTMENGKDSASWGPQSTTTRRHARASSETAIGIRRRAGRCVGHTTAPDREQTIGHGPRATTAAPPQHT
jgi:hypothetical protein